MRQDTMADDIWRSNEKEKKSKRANAQLAANPLTQPGAQTIAQKKDLSMEDASRE